MSKDKLKAKKKTQQPDEEFPTDWDVDYYRAEYESEEHWQLRRRFIEVHKKKFPEDKLVCLTQVFFNMEFMGCKYPSETMRLVGELSQDVAKEFREKRATKLKRTFVAASSAAEQRAKGRRTTQQQQQQHQQQHNSNSSTNIAGKRKHFDISGRGEQPLAQRPLAAQLFDGLRFGKFVLHLFGGRNCIRLSAQRCKMDFQEQEVEAPKQQKAIQICLDNQVVASACEENLKASKAKAFTVAIEILQQNCYSIKMNPSRDTVKIEKTDNNQVVCGVRKVQSDTLADKKLDATNKGYKMMKMMGWTGGGLGANTQGREEPVGYLLKNNRAGLGNDAGKLDRSYFSQMLQNYVESDDIRELQFESSFTKDERAMLHEIAGKFSLKSSSYGKDETRRLVISKKNISNETILHEVLINKNPNYIDQYHIQVPQTKTDLYLDHTTALELDM